MRRGCFRNDAKGPFFWANGDSCRRGKGGGRKGLKRGERNGGRKERHEGSKQKGARAEGEDPGRSSTELRAH